MSWYGRGTAKERGYGPEWQKLRKVILRRDGYVCQCKECKSTGAVRMANEVNHIISKAEARSKGWTQAQIDDPSNLESVNSDCHKRITMQQQGKTFTPKRTIGIDGWPVDGGGPPALGGFKQS